MPAKRWASSLDMLDYLLNPSAVDAMLIAYPGVRAQALRLKLSESEAHPSSEWHSSSARFAAFLTRATRAPDPAPRLAVVDSASASRYRNAVVKTTAEHEFRDQLAELLLIAALADSGFSFHSLPRAGAEDPDVTGTFPGLGSVSAEVYQPADDASKQAYMLELTDAVELADVPWNYLATIDWYEEPSRLVSKRDRSHKARHSRIRDTIEELFMRDRCPRDGSSSTCIDEVAGLRAEVRLSSVEPWLLPGSAFERAVSTSWSNPPWIVENDADAFANKVVNKANRRQAQSREADLHLLVVDCSNLRLTWDMSLTPDARTIDAVCLAVGNRLNEFPKDLDGLIVWNPNVPPGKAERVVAASKGLPEVLLDGLAGCPWPTCDTTTGLVKLLPAVD
jgi:hypothetical protein